MSQKSAPQTNRVTAHLQAVEEGYFEHGRHALSYAGPLLWAGLAAVIHAVFPFLFERVSSRVITRLHQKMAQRGRIGQ